MAVLPCGDKPCDPLEVPWFCNEAADDVDDVAAELVEVVPEEGVVVSSEVIMTVVAPCVDCPAELRVIVEVIRCVEGVSEVDDDETVDEDSGVVEAATLETELLVTALELGELEATGVVLGATDEEMSEEEAEPTTWSTSARVGRVKDGGWTYLWSWST